MNYFYVKVYESYHITDIRTYRQTDAAENIITPLRRW